MKLIKSTHITEPQLLRGTVTFAAGTSGSTAQHTVFTITGAVAFGFFARCTVALEVGGITTLSYGNAGVVADLMAATTASTIDAGDFLTPASTTVIEAAAFSAFNHNLVGHVSTGTDITADILTSTLTAGTMEYYLFWQPLSVGATVALGAELTAL